MADLLIFCLFVGVVCLLLGLGGFLEEHSSFFSRLLDGIIEGMKLVDDAEEWIGIQLSHVIILYHMAFLFKNTDMAFKF